MCRDGHYFRSMERTWVIYASRMESNNDNIIPFIRGLCPHLNEEELQEAQDNLVGYMEIALKIYARLEREKQQGLHDSVLTENSSEDRIT